MLLSDTQLKQLISFILDAMDKDGITTSAYTIQDQIKRLGIRPVPSLTRIINALRYFMQGK